MLENKTEWSIIPIKLRKKEKIDTNYHKQVRWTGTKWKDTFEFIFWILCQNNSIQNTLLEAFVVSVISLWNLKVVAGLQFKMMFKIHFFVTARRTFTLKVIKSRTLLNYLPRHLLHSFVDISQSISFPPQSLGNSRQVWFLISN